MSYLYVEHVNSALTANSLYEKLKIQEMLLMLDLQSSMPPEELEPLPDFVVAALLISISKHSIRAIIELEKRNRSWKAGPILKRKLLLI